MRKTKIKCGPAMFTRVCELIRKAGNPNPNVCDIAFLLDCGVRDVVADHARAEDNESLRGVGVPIMVRDGYFTTPEWFYEDKGKADSETER
jgi:hypothetical protein